MSESKDGTGKVSIILEDGTEHPIGDLTKIEFKEALPPGPIAELRPQGIVPLTLSVTREGGPMKKLAPTKMQTLVNALVATTKSANVDLDYADPRTRPGREVAKREAKEKLPALQAEYTALLRKGMAAIFVLGPSQAQKEFAEFAFELGPAPCLVVAADALYRRIAQDVQESMRNDRCFEPSQFQRFVTAYSTIGKELGMADMPAPKFAGGLLLKTFDDVVSYVRQLVRHTCGDELNAFYMQKLLTEKALEIRYQESVVPVVVTGITEGEVPALGRFFNSRFVKATVENKFDDDSVTKAFTELKHKLKKS